MRLECEWRHARKQWSGEFEDFEKQLVWNWLGQARDNFVSAIVA